MSARALLLTEMCTSFWACVSSTADGSLHARSFVWAPSRRTTLGSSTLRPLPQGDHIMLEASHYMLRAWKLHAQDATVLCCWFKQSN